jgi:hypothetical protein
MMAKLAAQAGASLRNKWSDPEYKKQVIRQRIARYVSGLISDAQRHNVTPDTYKSNRNANWIPRLDVALRYFDSFDEIVDAGARYNHRVVSMHWLEERADVYDITVDSTTIFCSPARFRP